MRALIPTLLAFALAAGCSRSTPTRVTADQARDLLINRNWLDKLPDGDRDRLHVLRFVPEMGGGVYQDRTLFAGQFELFTFEHSGDEIRFDLPHTREKATARYTIEALPEGAAPPPLDLRLTLTPSPRGPSTYYSSHSDRSVGDTLLDHK